MDEEEWFCSECAGRDHNYDCASCAADEAADEDMYYHFLPDGE